MCFVSKPKITQINSEQRLTFSQKKMGSKPKTYCMISIYVGGQLRTKAFTLASDAITSPELVVLDEHC